MKKKRLKALVRKWAMISGRSGPPGPVGPAGVAGKDMSEAVTELEGRVRRIEELLGKKLVGKIMKG